MSQFEQSGFFVNEKNGVATVTIDMPGPVNAMGAVFRSGFGNLITHLEQLSGLRGVIFRSGKKTFFAGGDINELVQAAISDLPMWRSWLRALNGDLRRLERLPVPTVAAINGAALGGGLELCLACKQRVVVDTKTPILGLPEVTLGIFPGAGGLIRTIHLAGVAKALPLAMEGTLLTPKQGLEVLWAHEIVATEEDLLLAAERWIDENPTAIQPWDRKGHSIPGGDITNPAVQGLFWNLPAAMFKKTRGLLPAPKAIATLAAESAATAFDTALRTQEPLFLELLMRPETKNLMMSNFIHAKEVKDGRSRPSGPDVARVGCIGVIGAGMMGRGIAMVAARKGIIVRLRDTSLEAAEQAKATIGEQWRAEVAKGRETEDAVADALQRIAPVAQSAELADCDMIIEAVFEDVRLKRGVVKDIEPFMKEGAIFGSNTSTLPISMLAQSSERPDAFVGIHFFSPVERMKLVEIIRGEMTSDETIARVYDFVRQIGKTPIVVVKDTPGFFTSRVYGPYLDEGALLVLDGADAVRIDNIARAAGLAVGPLTANDEVSLELSRKVISTLGDMGLYGQSHTLDGLKKITQVLVTEHGRGGRHYGGGYYDYPPGQAKSPWPRLGILFPAKTKLSDEDIRDRLLFRQSVEALKCIDEGVISVADANIGSLQGIGAPSWTGGYVQFANGYGLQKFKARALELADQYGSRFIPPKILEQKIAEGQLF